MVPSVGSFPPVTWKLPELRSGHPAPEELAERRRMVTGAPVSPGSAVEEQQVAGVRCLTVTDSAGNTTVVYLHGGGYRMGTPEAWVPLATRLSRRLGASVILPDYRLSPEHPFPAALIDAVSVYDDIRRSTAGPLLLAGDSAGGGLAAALTVACSLNGQALPDALVLLSPWLDLTLSGETFSSRSESDHFFPRESAEQAADSYLQGQDATDPLVSPLFAELDDFPPTLIFVGTEESLLDDAVRFAGKLAHARRRVALEVVAGMQHAWPVTSPDLPESSAAIGIAQQFTLSVLGLSP
jgi:monoterpene epsilon-lactone hydrolase